MFMVGLRVFEQATPEKWHKTSGKSVFDVSLIAAPPLLIVFVILMLGFSIKRSKSASFR